MVIFLKKSGRAKTFMGMKIIYTFICYRDLKPENILLNERMHILITDFGSAKLIHKSKRKRRRTGDNKEEPVESDGALEETSGEDDIDEEEDEDDVDGSSPPKPKRCSFVGTPEYVSPEMFNSRGTSRASDLWAIGMSWILIHFNIS